MSLTYLPRPHDVSTQEEGAPGALGRALLLPPAMIALLLVSVTGCGGSNSTAASNTSSSTTGATYSGPVNPDASGNWQITTTPTQGGAIAPVISGYLKDDITDPTASKYMSGELTATAASGCFAGTNPIFAGGTVQGSEVSLTSLSINGQYLTINATLDASSANMRGSYVVEGGCADGAQGSVTATRYAPLTGSYSGSTTGSTPVGLVLRLSQEGEGNGSGTFLVSGSATVTGISCFAAATLASPNGFVTGSTASLAFTTPDPSGAQLQLQGSFDAAADTLTVASIRITGGSCEGAYGSATLKLSN